MAAKPNVTTSAQYSTSAREEDFATRFTDNWDALRNIMGIMRPIRKAPGTKLVSYKASVDGGLKGGTVAEGDEIFIEKVDAEAGDAIVFDQVLAIVDGENTKFGTPVVEGAKVDAKVVKNGKGKKIRIFKYNPKKGYRKRQGHRQPYTKVEIGKISF